MAGAAAAGGLLAACTQPLPGYAGTRAAPTATTAAAAAAATATPMRSPPHGDHSRRRC